MKAASIRILAGVLALLSAFSAGIRAGEKKTVRLLTVGNSFSRNATNHLGDLAAAAGHILIHQPIIVGGASMQLHAEKAQTYEEDPKHLDGLYSNGKSLREHLTADAWNYVTIQQASIKSHDLATYRPYAGWLAGYIRKHAPGAKLLVHQTWPYRADDPRFTKPSGKAGEPLTQTEMYHGLSAAYREIARELNAGLLPVGDAFFLADSDEKWGFRPVASVNVTALQAPALPTQTHSLHVGWRWKKDADGRSTLGMDGHHANLAGEYLGACVWFEVIFGESAVENPHVPKGLDPGHAQFLREIAHRAAEKGHK